MMEPVRAVPAELLPWCSRPRTVGDRFDTCACSTKTLASHSLLTIASSDAVMFLFLASLFFAIRSFMPSHLRTIAHRARYYIYGDVSGLTPLSGEQW